MFGVSLDQGLGIHRIEVANRIYVNKDTHAHKMKNGPGTLLSLSFLITQQHVGDPTADGEQTSRLWALQGALQHIHLREEGKRAEH